MSDNPVLDAVFYPWRNAIVGTACRLGAFTRLEDGPMSAEALARELGCVPRLLEALLDACVSMGLLVREGAAYANSHLSRAHLVEGRRLYLGHILEVQRRGVARWEGLLDLVRTGEAPVVPGELDEQDPLFTMAMNDLGVYGEAEALAAAVDLSRRRTLVDVGCGSGIYAITLCRHNPRLTATLIDREVVLRTTERLVAASGVSDRIRLRAEDMTSGLGVSEVDVVLLSDSLYYDHATSLRVLRSAHAALNPGGTVIIRGYYSDPGCSEVPSGAVFRLMLLLFDPASAPPRTCDVAALLGEAGFRDVRWFPLTERSTCFVGNK